MRECLIIPMMPMSAVFADGDRRGLLCKILEAHMQVSE